MGRRWRVSADRHAAAPRRRAAQLPPDGVVGVSQDRRGGPVTPGELILYCDMSIGFEDVTVREDHTGRAPLDETVMFVDSLVARLPEGEKYSATKALPEHT